MFEAGFVTDSQQLLRYFQYHLLLRQWFPTAVLGTLLSFKSASKSDLSHYFSMVTQPPFLLILNKL